MKRIFRHTNIFLLLSTLVVINNSCSNLFSDPTKDKDTGEYLTLLLLDRNFFDTKINFYMVDEETGEYLTDDKFIVTIYGSDVDKIVNLDGEKRTEYTVTNGILELAVDPNYTPSADVPIEFYIVSETEEYKWYSIPRKVVITTTGVNDELIELLPDEDDELKSAFVTTDEPPFTASFTTTSSKKWNKKIYDPVQIVDGVNYYTLYRSDYKTDVFSDVTIKATDLSLTNTDNQKWGFNGRYYDTNNNYVAIDQMNSDGLPDGETYTNLKNFRFFTVTEGKYSACSDGLTANFDISTKNASALFNYTLTFSDGSTKKGILTLAQRINSESDTSYYSVINQIYYPNDGPSATIEITTDGQFDLEYDQKIENICGSTLTIKVTPKSDMYAYDFSTILTCEGGTIGAAPSMFVKLENKNNNKTTWAYFVSGKATLYLEKNTNYEITGTYSGESRTFGFSTDKLTAQSFGDSIANQEEDVASVTIEVTDPTDTTHGKEDITVIFTSEACPF